MPFTITNVADDVAPVTGTVLTGGSTDDTNLAVTLDLNGAGAQAGDTVDLYNTSGASRSLLISRTLTSADITANSVTVQTGALTNGTTYGIVAELSSAGSVIATSTNTYTVSVDNAAPVLSGLSATQSGAVAGVGDTITYTVTANEAVTVDGTPLLLLANNREVEYASGSGTNTLTFTYTLQAGDNEAGLDVTGLSLPTGTSIRDAAGNDADSTAVTGAPAGTLDVDADVPTVTAVTVSPATGTLAVGDEAVFTLDLSEAVALNTGAGEPTLTLSNAGVATYDASLSTPTQLAFRYTVQAGQDINDLSVLSYNANGATAQDAADNPVDFSGAAANPTGTLAVDATPPAPSALDVTQSDPTAGIGGTITYTLTLDEPVQVTGAPQLALGGARTAAFDALQSDPEGNNGPATLVFTYQVAEGDTDADLVASALGLDAGEAIEDAAGNPLVTALPAPNGAATVDADTPDILGVTASPDDGLLGAGGTITLTVTVDETVTVAGTGAPGLGLSNGATATYTGSNQDGTELTFTYEVQPGDTASTDLAVSGLVLGGTTILDAAGNALDPAGAATNPPGTLAVDATAPTLGGLTVSQDPAQGDTAGVGDTITYTVTASEAVTVDGAPSLLLANGRAAEFASGSGTGTLTFTYTVQAGDDETGLAVTSLDLPAGDSIRDAAGNDADTTAVAGAPAGTLDVDATAPTLSDLAVSQDPAQGATAGVGDTITFTLAADEAVTVQGGVPTLLLADDRVATYDAATSTGVSLVFTYTLREGDDPADLTVASLAPNDATILDAAGNPAVFAASAIGAPIGANALALDTSTPVLGVLSAAQNPAEGATAGIGDTILLTLDAGETVTVQGGPPELTLAGGTATYVGPSPDSTALTFAYTLQQGDDAADLTVVGLVPNGATILDEGGNAAVISAVSGAPPGADALAIDTVRSVVTEVTTSPGAGELNADDEVVFTVALDEAVTVTPATGGEVPTLALSGGGTATYTGTDSTGESLTFAYTVQPGQDTADLEVTDIALNGATVLDAAGNDADLTAAVANPPGTLRVDTGVPPAPVITGVTPDTGTTGDGVTAGDGARTITLSGTAEAGSTVTLTASRDGAIQLPIQVGTTVATGGTWSLQTDALADGIYSFRAAAEDAAGNVGPLSAPTTVTLDATAATIASVEVSPSGDAALREGGTAVFALTFSEAVAVTGAPTLALSDGRTAAYTGTGLPGTRHEFTYTVAAGDSAADLAVVGLSLSGGAIRDAAGNDAVLTGAAANPPGTLAVDTAAPTITAVAASPGTGSLRAGAEVTLTLTASETVALSPGAPPRLSLNNGRSAAYDADASTGTSLVFRYTVAAGDDVADLAVSGLSPNGATILDAAGNPLDPAGAVANPAGTLAIDTAAPTITAAAAEEGTTELNAGQTVTLLLTASETVTVDTGSGTPVLQLNSGGTAAYASTDPDGRTLRFTYTVQPDDRADALAIEGLDLNGATVRDAAGNALNLAVTGANLAGTLVVDNVPTVAAVTLLPGAGLVGIGATIAPVLVMSEAVVVDAAQGAPTLALSNGGTATYTGTDPTGRLLNFAYTVQAGQDAADLAVAGLNLNGATIRDRTGNDADLSGAAVNPADTLQVDARAPAAVSLTASPEAGPLRAGATVGLTLALDEAVALDAEAGAPTLALNNGGVATYDAAASTATSLAFTYTVAAGQDTADLAAVGLSLNGATIRDAAGNPLDPAGAALNPAGTLAIDTTAPGAPVVSGLGARPNAAGLAVRGTAEAGSTVAVYQNAVLLGTATAGSDGAWAVPLAGELGAGTYAYTATATDAAGNLSAASSASTVAVAAPPPAGAEPSAVAFDTGARGTTATRTATGDLVVTRDGVSQVLRGVDELQFVDGRLVFDQDDPAASVARLYRAGLGRDVDQGGLDFWQDAVEGGARLSDLARGFLASPEGQALYGADSSDAEFVTRLYRNVLGREGDTSGQAFWTSRLAEGASRADVLAAVADSGENRTATASQGVWDLDEDAAQVARLYRAVFGRLPDAGGLAYWTEALDAGRATPQDVAQGFISTPEAAAYRSLSNADLVRTLYQNVLGRPGDAGGVEYWTDRLDDGLNRAALVASFAESPENVARTEADIMGSAPGGYGIKLA